MPQELEIIERTYELIRWLHSRIEKFPRHSRFGLGNRMESCSLDILESLIAAKFSNRKSSLLQNANISLEKLRFLLRMTKDFHLISTKSHHFSVEQLVQISKQLQGWRKYAEQKEPTSIG